MFDLKMKPKFERRPATIEEAAKAGSEFVEFLKRLDWSKTALFYEHETSSSSARWGFRVIHFKDKVEEKWHDAVAQTWCGLGCMMS